MNQSISDLRQQVKITQFELDQELKNGGDTFEHRKHLRLAQEKLQEAEEADRKSSENEQASVQAALNEKAVCIITEQVNALNAEFDGLLAVQKPEVILPPSLALNVLTASDALASAKNKGASLNVAVSKLQKRRNTIETKKQELIEKRALDHTRDDEQDASTLALFDLDIKRLDSLIEEEKAASVIDTTSEQNALSGAEMMFSQAIKEERIRCLNEITSRLEIALIAAASQLTSMGVPASRRYKPSQALKSAAQAGVL